MNREKERKETVLRFLNASKDPINGLNRRDDSCSFQCNINLHESMVQEEVIYDRIISLRLRHISNPPPELTPYRSLYYYVTKLEVSCPVEPSWLFSLISLLPNLTLVRFGSSAFEHPFGKCLPTEDKWIQSNSAVKELRMSFDKGRLRDTEFMLGGVVEGMNKVFQYAAMVLDSLTRVELYVPKSAKIDDFIDKFPNLKEHGEIKEDTGSGGLLCFRSPSSDIRTRTRRESTSGSERGSNSPHGSLVSSSSCIKRKLSTISKTSSISSLPPSPTPYTHFPQISPTSSSSPALGSNRRDFSPHNNGQLEEARNELFESPETKRRGFGPKNGQLDRDELEKSPVMVKRRLLSPDVHIKEEQLYEPLSPSSLSIVSETEEGIYDYGHKGESPVPILINGIKQEKNLGFASPSSTSSHKSDFRNEFQRRSR